MNLLHPFWRRVLAIEPSQTEIARKSGVERRTINSGIVRGHLPRVDTAKKIANGLNVSLDFLTSDKANKEANPLSSADTAIADSMYETRTTLSLLMKEIAATHQEVLTMLSSIMENAVAADQEVQKISTKVMQHITEKGHNNAHESPPAYPLDEYMVSVPIAGTIEDADTDHMAIYPDTVHDVKVGTVYGLAAGTMKETWEYPDEFTSLPTTLVPSGKQHEYAVAVIRGTSMSDEGIYDGSKCLIRKQQSAENGQVVVARMHDTFTLKKLHRRNDGRTELLYRDGTDRIIIMDNDDFAIVGVLVKVLD